MVCRGKGLARVQNQEQEQEQERSPHVNRFFKVMFGRDIHKFLYLPPRFSRTMGGHFDGQETHIEDSRGLRWPVTISQVDGSLAFHKGWSEFFDDHGLKVGHFLVFSYTHVTKFLVHIFGESAYETTSFENVPSSPRRSKRLKINQDTINANSRDKPFQTNNVNAIGKPSSVPSQTEFRNFQKEISMEMEDPSLMINRRDDWCNTGEGSSILYDLSCFEMQQIIPRHTNDVAKSKKPLTTKIDAEMALGVCIEKINKALESNAVPSSHYVQMGQIKMAVSHENQKVHGNSGDEIADKFQKASVKKTDQNKMTAIQSKRLNANPMDILTKTFVKPSDNSNSSKTVKDDISKLCNALGDNIRRVSESPCMDRSKIAERSDEDIKSRSPESSLCSLVPRSPFGQPAVKNELLKLNIEGRGQKPIIATEDGKLNLQSVKAEPDLPCDTLQSDSFSPFSVEVESQSYLELPVHIPSAPGRRNSRRGGKVVYLRDPIGRLWPILYHDLLTVKAFTGNWARFCKQNSIMPGDECKFQPENGKMCAYRVDVRRSHRGDELPK